MARFGGATFPSRRLTGVFALGFALVIGLVFALVSLIASREGSSRPAPADPKGQAVAGGGNRPNVVVVLTDDQRATGTMDVMDRTRHLFLRSGIRFSRAFTPTPVCCPARATVFTGQYVHNHGVLTNGEDDLPQLETVQRYLDEAGYNTGIFGKYLNAWEIEEDPPHFDRWSIYKNSSAVYGETEWNEQGDVKNIVEYPTDYVARQASLFLENFAENKDREPWFLFLAPPNPHLPATPERIHGETNVGKWKPSPAASETDVSDKPPYVNKRSSGEHRTRKLVRRQRRSLLSVDDLVGSVAAQLKRLDEDRNTLFIFASDNGFLWTEHGMLGSLRSKANPYTDSVRVPLYVRWPEESLGPSTDSRMASLVDVAPTILHAAGLETDPGMPMDGQSLLKKWSRNEILLEFFPTKKSKIPRWNSVRTDDYQYVEYYGADGGITFREYYDLQGDPWQLVNLFGDGKPANDPGKKKLSKTIKRLGNCAGLGCP